MAISDRITSIEEHIKESYQELEGIGIDTTEVDKNLKNIPKLIDGYWETLPKVTGEGTSITLDNTKEGKMKINLKGNTSQETTTGKNLIGLLFVTPPTKVAGANFDYSLNSFTLQGTTTSTWAIINLNYNFKIQTGKTYTMSANVTGTNPKMQISAIGYDTSRNELFRFRINQSNNYTQTLTTNFSNPIEVCTFVIEGLENGGTYNLSATDIQIEESATKTSFEPYTNGASPNPDYPQDIHVVSGDNSIKVEGKNLWGEEEHGGIDENTGVDFYNATRWRTVGFISAQPNTSYTISSNASSNIWYIFYYYDKNKNFISSKPLLGTTSVNWETPSNCKYMRCVIADTASITTTQRQLEVGSTATTFEEYKGASYPIYLGVKNLIDFNRTAGVFSGNGTTFEETKYFSNMSRDSGTGSSCELVSYADNVLTIKGRYGQGVGFPIRCKPNQSYFVKVTSADSNARLWLSFYDNTGTFISGSSNDSNLERSVISPSNSYWVIPIFGVYGSSLTNVEFSNIKVLEGNKEQTISPTPIELCKIGDYQDSIVKDNGKWYVNKQIGKVVLDGSESWEWNSGQSGAFTHWFLNHGKAISYSPTLCDYFINSQSTTWVDNRYGFDSVGGTMWIRNTSKFSSLSDLTTWLGTNLPIVYYVLATPTYTEITDSTLLSQLEALNGAKSYTTQTNINQENNDNASILNASALSE